MGSEKRGRAIAFAPRAVVHNAPTAPVQVVVADPAWSFGDNLPGDARGAAKHYATMTQAGIEAHLPALVREGAFVLAPDALLFLWRVASQPEEAVRVCRAWGFAPKSEMVWIKTSLGGGLAFGMGRYVRHCHEVCIIAARGRGARLIQDRAVRSVFKAPRLSHSRKPSRFYEIVEQLVGDVPRVELFARGPRPGWGVHGYEARPTLTEEAKIDVADQLTTERGRLLDVLRAREVG